MPKSSSLLLHSLLLTFNLFPSFGSLPELLTHFGLSVNKASRLSLVCLPPSVALNWYFSWRCRLPVSGKWNCSNCHISALNELIRANKGKLYNLNSCSFRIVSLSKKMTVKEGATASIPWIYPDFNVFGIAPKCFWLRDFLIFNVKFCSEIFINI